MEVDGESERGVNLNSLREKFSREFVNLYLKIACSARRQNNYAVATRYLKLMERALGEVSIMGIMQLRTEILRNRLFLDFNYLFPPALSKRC